MMDMKIKPFRVSDINAYVKNVLSRDPILSNIQIEGEIFNFKWHSSGHLYFSLKDDKSRLKTVMFKQHTSKLLIKPVDGMKVVISGYISVYERDGNYQLYAESMILQGQGDLYLKYEELKRKLEEKGMFDLEHKQSIPKFAETIGVVTSDTGAAVRDIISVIKRRMPFAQIVIYPSLVQGIYAAENLCEAIKFLDKRSDIDVIIIGRGGGSIEELWAFNDEKLAKTIYKCKKPVISAVGHETDFTICDLVSDLRVPTPSVAGEVAVIDVGLEINELKHINNRLKQGIDTIIAKERLDLERCSMSSSKNQILINFENEHLDIKRMKNQIVLNVSQNMSIKREQLKNLGNLLDAYSPLKTVDRGYSIVETDEKTLVKSIDDVNVGDLVDIKLKKGSLKAKIIDKIH